MNNKTLMHEDVQVALDSTELNKSRLLKNNIIYPYSVEMK